MTKILKIYAVIFIVAFSAVLFVASASAQTAPDLRDMSANVTGPHNAVLSIFVDPNGSPTTLHFKYWTGSTFQERLYLGASGNSFIKIDVGLINLIEGSAYSYQVTAENGGGSTSSSTGTFNTPGGGSSSSGSSSGSYSGSSGTSGNSSGSGNSYSGTSSNTSAPLVTTNGPASVSTNSATINGSINPNGSNTNFWFEFGTSQSLGQKTTVQSVGSGYSWQLVTGNLSNLEKGRTYYYRVFAQNNYGLVSGDIMSFTTSGSSTSGTSGGQVLGTVSGSGNGTNTTSGTNTGTNTNSTSGTSKPTSGQSSPVLTGSDVRSQTTSKNSRPSFISLEYSLEGSSPLVLVADNLKPNPGEEFNYTVVYKNNSQSSFNEANLKVIIPSDADYVGASIEPSNISGTTVEFNLGDVLPSSTQEVVIIVKLKETVKPGNTVIFTSVLGYKDRIGTQLATTSYLTVKAGSSNSDSGLPLSAFSLGSLVSSTSLLILFALGLVVLMGILVYRFLKIRNDKKNKNEEEDIFGKGGIPSTFEPVSDGSFPRR